MSEQLDREDLREVEAIANAICPLLAGRKPRVQGAALADLVATWLKGHVIEDDPQATAELRKTLLVAHMKFVRVLAQFDT
jgi:hypothetical protein